VSQPLNFDDLATLEEHFAFQGASYVLREPTAEAACRWKNAITRAVRMGPDGKPSGVVDIADTDPLLVSLCLWEVKDGKEVPVPLATVRSWPSRVLNRLFERAREMGELNPAAAEGSAAKNGHAG
jgi:hypothetical protein